MVIRWRLRAILIPVALYGVAGPVSAYFLWHAVHGERGLQARASYQVEIRHQLEEASALTKEKQALERRIALLRAQAVDQDILEEQARIMLGRVRPEDVVIFLPAPGKE